MPYVHLANGEVLTLTDKELAVFSNTSAPNTIHRDNIQHQVIGVYPDAVELVQDQEVIDAADEKAEYEEWKAAKANKQNVSVRNEDEFATADEKVRYEEWKAANPVKENDK